MRTLLALALLGAVTPLAAAVAPASPSADLGSSPVTMNFLTGFSPPVVMTAPGSSVTWRNTDAVLHTATSLLGGPPNSGNILPGASYTATFASAGVTVYSCGFHPWMVGLVIVN